MVTSEKSERGFEKYFARGLALLASLIMVISPMAMLSANEDLKPLDTHTGSSNNSLLGCNITEIGDIGGSNDVDYAVCAPGIDTLYIWEGPLPRQLTTAIGRTGSPDWIITGPSGSEFGRSVANIPDYKGSDKDEFIVGSPGEDKAYLFLGGTGSSSMTQDDAELTFVGRDGELFGHSVSGITYYGEASSSPSLYAVIGAPQNSHSLETSPANVTTGGVFLFNLTEIESSGGSSYLWHQAHKKFFGGEKNEMFGWVVMSVGDLNVDGIDDLSIGDPFYDWDDSGIFYINYGKNPGFENDELIASAIDDSIIGNSGSKFGWSTARVGDIGGPDVVDDLVVGAPQEGNGKVYLFYGNTTLNGNLSSGTISPTTEFIGNRTGDLFGWSISFVEMGENDKALAIGAPGYDNGTDEGAGAIYGFYESFNSIETASDSDTKFYGESPGDGLGMGLSKALYGGDSKISILASAPYFDGTGSDNGKLYVLERNLLPELKLYPVTPSNGNTDTDFKITVNYKDPEGDIPEFVEFTISEDSVGSTPILTLRANKTQGEDDFTSGVNYTVVTKLPNSVIDSPNNRNKHLYVRANARAKRGSLDLIMDPDTQSALRGPVVDGIVPNTARLVEAKTGSDSEKEGVEGTIRVKWIWPGDDYFPDPNQNVYGKVDKLTLKYRKDERITPSNWDDSNTKTYREWRSAANIEEPGTEQDFILIGDDDLITNPNSISFTPREDYYFAFQAEDDQGNKGPISDSPSAEAWWERPDIPQANPSVTLKDVPNDGGGKLNLSWTPSSLPEDDLYCYWVFIFDSYRDTIMPENGPLIEPDINITPGDEEFNDTTMGLIIDSYSGGEIQDGESYYAAIVALNWLGQFTPIIEPAGPTTVINDQQPPIPRLSDLTGSDTPDDFGGSIELTWTPTNEDRFTEYIVYGASYPFNDLDDAREIATIEERDVSSFTVTNISGISIGPGKLYSFAIVIKDYNNHLDTDLVESENYITGIRAIDNNDETPEDQVENVKLEDKKNDNGGALIVTWSGKIIPGEFWRYNLYFSDEPMDSIVGMEPLEIFSNYKRNEFEINKTKDNESLIDGKDYYAAVTIVDYNNNENTLLEMGKNYDGPVEPVNQSDVIPPSGVSGLGVDDTQTDVKENSINISWNAVTWNEVKDFDHYILTWWEIIDYPEEISIYDRERNWYVVDRLERGTTYHFNISIVDDNGNRGPSLGEFTQITAGVNEPPFDLTISISYQISGKSEYFSFVFKNETDTLSFKEEDVLADEVYFSGGADDDYTTNPNKLIYNWTLETPSGKVIYRNDTAGGSIQISEIGTYKISLLVGDDEGAYSEPFEIEFKIEKDDEAGSGLGLIIIFAAVLIFIILIAAGFFIWISGKRSTKKERLQEYEEKKKEIDSMEPIFTNLPTWTCSCGQTQVPITEDAHCSSCFESFEGVPIEGIDEYLKNHELVLSEMRISTPPGWQGQEQAIADAEKDLEERKKRALDDLKREYADVLEGEEAPPPETEEETGQPPSPPGPMPPGQTPTPGGMGPQPQQGQTPPMMGTQQPQPAQTPGAQPPRPGAQMPPQQGGPQAGQSGPTQQPRPVGPPPNRPGPQPDQNKQQ